MKRDFRLYEYKERLPEVKTKIKEVLQKMNREKSSSES